MKASRRPGVQSRSGLACRPPRSSGARRSGVYRSTCGLEFLSPPAVCVWVPWGWGSLCDGPLGPSLRRNTRPAVLGGGHGITSPQAPLLVPRALMRRHTEHLTHGSSSQGPTRLRPGGQCLGPQCERVARRDWEPRLSAWSIRNVLWTHVQDLPPRVQCTPR